MSTLKASLSYIEARRSQKAWDLKSFIESHSKKQQQFIKSKSKTTIFVGGKRSGKTLGATSLAIIMDQGCRPVGRIIFASATIEKAKGLYWKNFLKADKSLKLGWKFHSGRNTIDTGKREIIFRGLRDIPSADLDVGLEILAVNLEEPQTIREKVLKHYWSEVVRWNLLTQPEGRVNILGNPPAFLLKTYQSINDNPNTLKIPISMYDNPVMTKATIDKFLEEEAKDRGYKSLFVAMESPTFQRNVLGKWVLDTDRTIFHKDNIETFAELPPNENWKYVMGVDFGGGRSYDAIVVLAYNVYERKIYVVEEWEGPTQKEALEGLATRIKGFCNKYNPEAIAFDHGGLGHRLAYILQYGYGVSCLIPAEKQDKMSYLTEMRTEAHAGRLVFRSDSKLMEEFPQIIFTEDFQKVDDKEGLHSDLLDACLYSFRHIFASRPKERPKAKSINERMLERRLDKLKAKNKKGDFYGYFS